MSHHSLSSSKRSVGWTINPQALTKARHTLGLQETVTVAVKHNWWWGGDYTPVHTIRVSNTELARDVSYIIWHELGHALQCERDFNGNGALYIEYTNALYDAFYDSDGNNTWDSTQEPLEEWKKRYLSIPLEVEAEEIAQRYAYKYPLITI